MLFFINFVLKNSSEHLRTGQGISGSTVCSLGLMRPVMLVLIHFHLSCLYCTQLCLLAVDAGGSEAHAGVPHRLRLQKLKFIANLPSRGRHRHAAGRLMLDLRAELDVVLHTILHTVLHYQLAAHTHLVVGRASSGPSR